MTIPTNIVDASQQIKDGTLGVIEVVKMGDLIVSALIGLQIPSEKEVTRRPVQAGFTVIDGMIDVPTDIIMDVVLANPDFSPEALVTAGLTGGFGGFTDSWRQKKTQLYAMFDSREIVTVQTHENTYPYRAISRINPVYDPEENWECWIGQVTLTTFNNSQTGAIDDVATALTSAKQSVGGL